MSHTDTVSTNSPPRIDAGSDRIVEEGASVTLTGTATDIDDDQLTYLWNQTAGSPTVVLTGPDTLLPVFTAPAVSSDTEFVFEMTVSDDSDRSTDTVKVTVRDVPDNTPFITTWQTTTAGESITIPVGGASGAYTVDWGDGNTSVDVTGDQTHVYDDAGTYTVSISGDFTRIYLNEQQPNADKLQSIEQWGDARWESMKSAFHGASNVVYNAVDTPVLSDVTTMKYMFYDASSFDGDLSGWNVSHVRDMSGVFWGASSFDGDLSGWDVSGVTNMKRMLSDASSFNGDISEWDVSHVRDMAAMFFGASVFNADISGWDVSHVTDMAAMFAGASAFNADISSWDVSSVTITFAMFMDAKSFDADISGWDVSNVTEMHAMFRNAKSFDADISGWDVSNVNGMSEVFYKAKSFDADISGWDVSQVTNMRQMFESASSFNADISGWDVSNVTHMNYMLSNTRAFDQNLGAWYIVLDSTSVDGADRTVGEITAQNSFLDGQNPAYGLGSGGDSDHFEIDSTVLKLKAAPTKSPYTVTITSTGDFGTNNSHTFEIDVVGGFNDTPPVSDPTDGGVTDRSEGGPEANSTLVVEAGSDQTVQEGAIVTLSGTVTGNDVDHVTYLWTHNSDLAIQFANDTSVSATFTAPAVDTETDVSFTLTVFDGTFTVSDSLDVTITNSNTTTPIVPSTPSPSVTPSNPRDIDVISLTSTQPGTIQVTWVAPSETPQDYRIKWAKADETWRNPDGSAFPTSPNYTLMDLEEGEEYKVNVRARYDSGGPGDWSGVVTITVARTG